MNAEQKSFIEELRSLSEPVKRKIFWGAAAVSMVVIVYLWLAYFNTIVPSANPMVQPTAPTSTQATEQIGVLGLFADTASSFWQTIGSGAQELVGVMKNSKQYNISPK
jgi:hypothetical protein